MDSNNKFGNQAKGLYIDPNIASLRFLKTPELSKNEL